MMKYNEECILPAHLGCAFDTTPVVNEVAACTSIVLEYQEDLIYGRCADAAEVEAIVAEFRAKLAANGAEKIVAEVQAQVDAWMAAK